MSDDAPFGFGSDGKPLAPYGKTATGRIKKDSRGRPTKTAGRGPAAPKPKTTRPSGGGTSARGKRNYAPPIKGLLHTLALPLLPTMPNDAAAILIHADEVANAFNDTAQMRPEIAAMCEKIMTVGPYGLLIAALLKPAAQIAVNHGLIPEQMAQTFGAVPPSQLGEQLALVLNRVMPAPRPANPEPQVNSVNGHQHAHTGV